MLFTGIFLFLFLLFKTNKENRPALFVGLIAFYLQKNHFLASSSACVFCRIPGFSFTICILHSSG